MNGRAIASWKINKHNDQMIVRRSTIPSEQSKWNSRQCFGLKILLINCLFWTKYVHISTIAVTAYPNGYRLFWWTVKVLQHLKRSFPLSPRRCEMNCWAVKGTTFDGLVSWNSHFVVSLNCSIEILSPNHNNSLANKQVSTWASRRCFSTV